MENACAQGTATVLGKSAKILQVENNKPIRNWLSRCLLQEDFEVIFATECRQGLAMASMDSCDRLLADKSTPGAGGLEVTATPPQKFLTEKPPTILISLTATSQGISQASVQGANRYPEQQCE
jgi:CheY-like chemotaxis protein